MLRLLGLAPGQAGAVGTGAAGAGTAGAPPGPLDASSVEGALQQMRSLALARSGLTEADVAARLAARSDARASKDFAAGDAIRDELAASGVMVMDTPGGSSWRPCAVGDDSAS
jgi:cysteinyl-tRNA synthetase